MQVRIRTCLRWWGAGGGGFFVKPSCTRCSFPDKQFIVLCRASGVFDLIETVCSCQGPLPLDQGARFRKLDPCIGLFIDPLKYFPPNSIISGTHGMIAAGYGPDRRTPGANRMVNIYTRLFVTLAQRVCYGTAEPQFLPTASPSYESMLQFWPLLY